MLYISGWRHVDYIMVITREIASHGGPGTWRQASVTVQVLPLQPGIVESKIAVGQAVKGPQLYGAIGIHVAQGSVGAVIGPRTGVRAVPVVDPTILKVRLKLSYVIIRAGLGGLIWLILIQGP